MPDLQRFLEKLISKSEQRRVPWRLTAESDKFAASLDGEFTVSVAATGKQEYVFEMRDKRDNKLVHISAEKAHAWEQGYEEAVEHFQRLRLLFEAARRQALDVDNQISRAESLLDEF